MNIDIEQIKRNNDILGYQYVDPFIELTEECIQMIQLKALGERELQNGKMIWPVLYGDRDNSTWWLLQIVTHAYLAGMRAERARRKNKVKS
ncbi:hypothetical protein [Veillonella caviae]|uniref:hypothetical protein n=1 Tax=Veillonella caviae TaxID=248316 RepID=UPI0023F7857C|nr:hypothetical protein [Veillonella caviae]MCI7693255.1 hypothetical protein [Veillonella caviae]MDY5253703.1 hypothetical protein [Veillonella caviae]